MITESDNTVMHEGARELARIRHALIHAVTKWDEMQRRATGYNLWALPQYLQAVDRAMARIEKGKTVREALLGAFLGRLLDACLRAVGEPVSTKEEVWRQPLCQED